MCLDIPVQTIFDEVGHDGTQVIFPTQKPPKANRGFHLQELIDICDVRGYSVTEIQARPAIQTGDEIWDLPYADPQVRFVDHLTGYPGVLVGYYLSSRQHAIAWDGQSVFDPAGYVTKIDQFRIISLYKIRQISRLDV